MQATQTKVQKSKRVVITGDSNAKKLKSGLLSLTADVPRPYWAHPTSYLVYSGDDFQGNVHTKYSRPTSIGPEGSRDTLILYKGTRKETSVTCKPEVPNAGRSLAPSVSLPPRNVQETTYANGRSGSPPGARDELSVLCSSTGGMQERRCLNLLAPASQGAAPPPPASQGAAPPPPASQGAGPPPPAAQGAAPPPPASQGAGPPPPAAQGAAPPPPAAQGAAPPPPAAQGAAPAPQALQLVGPPQPLGLPQAPQLVAPIQPQGLPPVPPQQTAPDQSFNALQVRLRPRDETNYVPRYGSGRGMKRIVYVPRYGSGREELLALKVAKWKKGCGYHQSYGAPTYTGVGRGTWGSRQPPAAQPQFAYPYPSSDTITPNQCRICRGFDHFARVCPSRGQRRGGGRRGGRRGRS
ncbi:C17orf97 [Branchiostoma lanceolatum]|uniref:C17orf97 protein n=1 Tax=Branchiostoma lanceolatum TaxID=7740 RepID=A0A8K0E5N3_BRALA|nr:C17orf97 [Branchiostoma lanceolatum]